MQRKLWLLIWLFSGFVTVPVAQGAITLKTSGFSSIGTSSTGGQLQLRATMGQPVGGVDNQQAGFWSAITPLSQPASTPGEQPETPDDGGIAPPPQVIGQPPKVQNPVAQQNLVVGGDVFTQDLSGVFVDPDGGNVTIRSAGSSDTKVVTVVLQGTNLTVTPIGAGSATVKITGKDETDAFGTSEFVVIVTEPAAPANQVPTIANAVDNQSLTAKGEPFVQNLNADPKVFTDGDGDPLTLLPSTSDAAVARVTLSGNTLTVTPLSEGSATVTVTATDDKGSTVAMTFTVSVSAPPPENNVPVIANTIGDQVLTVGEAAFVRDLNAEPLVFNDPDNNRLEYGAVSNDESVASVGVVGSTITITAVTPGEAVILIVADDKSGGRVEMTFRVTSQPKPLQAPVAVLSANPTSGTAPLTVQFEDKSTNNPTKRTWSFGDGGNSGDVMVSHTYNDPGSYIVTLTVENDDGTASVTEQILVEKSFEPPLPEESAPLILAEYFVDVDPGFGLGTPVQVASALSATAEFDVQTQGLEEGFHTLFVRFKDQRGNWGFAQGSQFYVAPVADGVVFPLVRLEYFFDGNDPGVGSALGIEVERSQIISGEYDFDTRSLDIGTHTVTVRAQDATEIWGLGLTSVFEVNEEGPSNEEDPSVKGQALRLTDGAMEAPALDERSLELWFKADAPDQMAIYGGGSHSRDRQFELHMYKPGGIGFGPSTQYGLYVVFHSNDVIIPYDAIKEGWHHVVVAWDGQDGVTVGIDGQFLDGYILSGEQQSQPFKLPRIPSPDVTVTSLIGQARHSLWGQGKTVFSGEIDEVRIWNRALTPSEIVSNMGRTITGPENGLLAHYDFDSVSGGTIQDRSGNGNHGTLMGDAILVQSTAPLNQGLRNQLPRVSRAIAEVSLVQGGDSFVLNLNAEPKVFEDPEGDALIFTAISSDDQVASVQVSGSGVTVTPVGVGQALITLRADDGNGHEPVSTALPVVVNPGLLFVTLGSSVDGHLLKTDDAQFVKFTLEETKDIAIDVLPEDTLDVSFSLFRGDSFADVTDANLLNDDIDGSGIGELESLTSQLEPGSYLLSIKSFANSGNFTVRLRELVIPELVLGDRFEGALVEGNASQIIKFTIDNATDVEFTLLPSSSLDTEFEIYKGIDPDSGELIESIDVGSAGESDRGVVSLEEGSYAALIKAYEGLGNYVFETKAAGFSSVTFNEKVEGLFSVPNEQHVYALKIEEEKQIRMPFVHTDSLSVILSIFRGTGFGDLKEDNIVFETEFLGFEQLTDELFYILQPGNYLLSFTVVSDLKPYSFRIEEFSFTPLVLEENVSGKFMMPGQEHFRSLSIQDSTLVTFNFATDDSLVADLSVYRGHNFGDLSEENLVGDSELIGFEFDEEIPARNLPPGQYVIVLTGFETGDYTFGAVGTDPLPTLPVLALNETIEGALAQAGERHYLIFQVEEELNAILSLTSEVFNARLAVYATEALSDTAGAQIADIDFSALGSEIFQTTFAPGSYIVEILDAFDEETGVFSVSLNKTALETIAAGETNTSTLSFEFERQYFALTLEDSAAVTVNLSSDVIDTFVEFLEGETIESASFLVENDDIADDNFNAQTEVIVGPGKYLIAAGGYAPGTYSIRVDTKVPLPVADVTPLAFGETLEGNLDVPGSRVYYRFEVVNDVQALEISLVADEFDGVLALYVSESLRDTTDARIATVDLSAVGVEGFLGLFDQGSYTIGVSEFQDTGTGSFSIGLSEVVTQAITVDASSTGVLHYPSDADFYELTVSSTGPVTIDLTSEDNTDVFLNLYGGKTLSSALANDVLAFSDDVTTENLNAQLVVTLSSGTYIVEAGAYGAGSYSLVVSTNNIENDRVGPIALDLNPEVGDQGQRNTDQIPKNGDMINIDLVATEGGKDLSGFQIVLSYNQEALQFSGVIAKDLFAGAVPLDFGDENKVTISMAFLGQNATPRESGSLAEITFEVLEGFNGETGITLISGEFAQASEQQPLDIGSGGAFVTIGGEGSNTGSPSPDIDDDGLVGFSDFLIFAQAFGTKSGDINFNAKADLNSDGEIGFSDFLQFANKFGQPVGEKPLGLSKRAKGIKPGVNGDAGLSLIVLENERPDQINIIVNTNDIVHVLGYNLQLVYDPAVLEPVEAIGPGGSMFQVPELAGVALQVEPEAGQLIVADMLNSDSALTQDGQLVTITFRVLDPTTISRVDVIEGVLSDGNHGLNILDGIFVDGIRFIPNEFALDQNYPNPFNPETVIRYQLPKSSDVALTIYNVLGQRVRQLVHVTQKAGYYQVVWDGTNEAGHSVSSGVYFYRLMHGNNAQTKRMMLLK